MATRITSSILGQAQAESDGAMLRDAFIDTPEYRTLLVADHAHIVVGRRGAGKSALFLKLRDYHRREPNLIAVDITPDELDIVGLKTLCTCFGDEYLKIRGCARLAWHAAILCEILAALRRHYRAKHLSLPERVVTLAHHWNSLSQYSPTGRLYELLRGHVESLRRDEKLNITELSHALGTRLLKEVVVEGLDSARLRAIVVLDRLDEGWVPDASSTAFVAGLLTAANDLGAGSSPICTVVFVRDNIHRSIAKHDTDYTRNIEGISCRLHWDEAALFRLVCARLRVAFGLQGVESDEKVWNRVADREVRNREGFRRCLKHTLYRPRDILSLLNRAFLIASRNNQDRVIETDVQAAAHELSADRLADLEKEYDSVFPGIRTIIAAFRECRATLDQAAVLRIIDAAACDLERDPIACQHFSVVGRLGILQGLYAIGFLGILDNGSRQFQFCHDGRAPEAVHRDDAEFLVHPCFHLALSCNVSDEPNGETYEIFDEHDIAVVSDQVERRSKEIGQLLAEEGKIPKGNEGFVRFEKWCRRTLAIVCAGHLANFELHPNRDGVNQRDIVATCMAKEGFWRRLFESYDTRQVVFEVKNVDEVKKDDVSQLAGYLGDHYGSAGFIVTRSLDENPNGAVLGWIREHFVRERKLILLLPAKILHRLLGKARGLSRHDVVGEQLNKLLDRYERRYLELPAERGRRRA